MQWKFFLGACILTGAALLPHSKAAPVFGGMVLAALMHWAFWYTSRR